MNRFLLPNLVFALRVAVMVGLAVYVLQCVGAAVTRVVVVVRCRKANIAPPPMGRSPLRFTATAFMSMVSVVAGLGLMLGGLFAAMARLATPPRAGTRNSISQRPRHQARHRPGEARGAN